MEPNVRGYTIRAATQFLLGDPGLRAKCPPEFVERVTEADPALKVADWYPRSRLMEIYLAIATGAPGEQEAYAQLVRCGKATASHAIKGYLKLLLKMLTPRMFAGKFPDFWARDHQSGHAEVGVIEDKRLVLRFIDIGGFDHIGPVSAGFVSFAMEAIGMKDVVVKCTPWSLAEPGANDVDLEVRWR